MKVKGRLRGGKRMGDRELLETSPEEVQQHHTHQVVSSHCASSRLIDFNRCGSFVTLRQFFSEAEICGLQTILTP